MLNISAKKFKILFNNVDYTESVIDSVKFEVNWNEYTGLSLVSGSVSLFRKNETTVPIEPENNPNIFIGGTCIYEEWDYTTNQFVRHPHFGYTIIQTVPRVINSETSYYSAGITIELSCLLNYLKEKDLVGDCSGIAPGQSLTRRQVIENLLYKASGGTGLLIDSTEPSDLITFPPEAQKSIIETIGLLALMSPDGPWFVWADGNGEFRLSRESDALNNNITLAYNQKDCATQRLDSGDFGRPFSELKVNSVIQKVNVFDTLTVTNSGEYAQVYMAQRVGPPTLSGTHQNVVQQRPVLTEGKTVVRRTDFSTFLAIQTTYTTTILVVDRGNGGVDYIPANNLPPGFSNNNTRYGEQFQREPNTDFSYVLPTNAYIITSAIINETVFFHSKPANWDSCNIENNPVTLAGLPSTYLKDISRYDFFANKLKKVLNENRSYSYDSKRWLRRRATNTSVLTAYEGSYITKDGTPIEKFSPAFGKIETWDQLACDKWRQTTIENGPGGDADAEIRYDSRISASPPTVTDDSPPSADFTVPDRYEICEETVTVTANINVNAIFNKTKTISFPFTTSKEQLQKLAKNRLQLTYQKAFGGMAFEISSSNPYFKQNASTPVFSIIFTEPDGKIIKLRSLRYVYESDFNSSVVIIDSAKTGVKNDAGDFLPVGNVKNNYPFTLKLGGTVTTSTLNAPKIVKNLSFNLTTKLNKKGVSWFEITQTNWFGITRSNFFTINR